MSIATHIVRLCLKFNKTVDSHLFNKNWTEIHRCIFCRELYNFNVTGKHFINNTTQWVGTCVFCNYKIIRIFNKDRLFYSHYFSISHVFYGIKADVINDHLQLYKLLVRTILPKDVCHLICEYTVQYGRCIRQIVDFDRFHQTVRKQ
jgi:hypothetical protein